MAAAPHRAVAISRHFARAIGRRNPRKHPYTPLRPVDLENFSADGNKNPDSGEKFRLKTEFP
jgi:hypothetical protein